jgi:hypothetical protein
MFKVGDRVLIKKDSKYYNVISKNDPKDMLGTIVKESINRPSIKINGDHIYMVDWDSGGANIYSESDLEAIDTFVLPDKWAILCNLEIRSSLDRWFKLNIDRYPHDDGKHTYWHYPESKGICTASFIEDSYTLITYEQFKKYVLKEGITIDSEGYTTTDGWINILLNQT